MFEHNSHVQIFKSITLYLPLSIKKVTPSNDMAMFAIACYHTTYMHAVCIFYSLSVCLEKPDDLLNVLKCTL